MYQHVEEEEVVVIKYMYINNLYIYIYMSFEEKYLKYKNKYLKLKSLEIKQTGGSFFNFSSYFNKSEVADVKQSDIQNQIIKFNELVSKMNRINAKVNDKDLDQTLKNLNAQWNTILNNLISLEKFKEENEKKYNGLLVELKKKQLNIYELRKSLDSLPDKLKVDFKNAQNFIKSVELEVQKSESKLTAYESQIANKNARNQYNNVIHERRLALNQEKKTRSRSSSTSSSKSLDGIKEAPKQTP